jgi:hypothetical protein
MSLPARRWASDYTVICPNCKTYVDRESEGQLLAVCDSCFLHFCSSCKRPWSPFRPIHNCRVAKRSESREGNPLESTKRLLDGERVPVLVTLSWGKLEPLQVTFSMTVAEFLQLVNESTGEKIARRRVMFRGKVLPQDTPLGAHGITKGCMLTIFRQVPLEEMLRKVREPQ